MEALRALGWAAGEPPVIEVAQDLPAGAVSAGGEEQGGNRRPRSVSSATDAEWHLVSPNSSEKGSPRSVRSSFEAAGAADQRSICSSESTAQNESLAESILGQPIAAPPAAGDVVESTSEESLHDLVQRFTAAGAELSAAAAAAAASEADESSTFGLMGPQEVEEMEDDMDAVRAASMDSQEGSLDGCADALLGGEDAQLMAGSTEANGLGGWELLLEDLLSRVAKVPAAALGGLQGASAALAGGLEGVREWAMASATLLLEGVRAGGHNAVLAIQGAVSRLLSGVMITKGSSLDWTHIITSAACAVLLGALVFTYKENGKLRNMLRRRDHELSKLVMRVVSLQELLHQQRSLAMSRYSGSIATAHSFL